MRARRIVQLVGVLMLASCDGLVLDADDGAELDTATDLGDGPDGADEVEDELHALTDVGGTTVVQVNPFYGGQFDDLDTSGPVTYGTARRFARMLDRFYRRASVIGMEEITSPENAETVRQILVEETGQPGQFATSAGARTRVRSRRPRRPSSGAPTCTTS